MLLSSRKPDLKLSLMVTPCQQLNGSVKTSQYKVHLICRSTPLARSQYWLCVKYLWKTQVCSVSWLKTEGVQPSAVPIWWWKNVEGMAEVVWSHQASWPQSRTQTLQWDNLLDSMRVWLAQSLLMSTGWRWEQLMCACHVGTLTH